MKETVVGLIKIVACILMLMFAEVHFFGFLTHIGINTSEFSPLIREMMLLVLYALMFFVVYLMYQHHVKKDLGSYKRRLFPNVLMSIAYFAILTIFIWLVSYITSAVAESMDVTYRGLSFYNIFNQEFDLILVSFVVRRIVLLPFMLVIVYVLGIYDLVNSKKSAIFLTGLLAAGIAAIGMNGTFLVILLNAIPYFTIFFVLSYIY